MPSYIGKYEIRGELGRGGSGAVYEAYDPSVARRVAIKVLHTSSDPDTLLRFRQEASAAGNLRHKNIVTIHESGEHEGAPYIVMEYVEGEDLQRIIQSGALKLLEKIQIMREVAEGLQYAHSMGVAHRDVKPANIMVQPDRSVKIMDFGTARLLRETGTRLTQTGFVLGTIKYMAPEQFRGADSGQMADIYAYGATYYELISGKAPFAAADTAALMYKILHEAPAPLSAFAPDCPPALEALILHALEKDPNARYQSMEDALLDSVPILQELSLRQATDLVEKSRKLLDELHLEDAQEYVRQALTLDPGNREARRLYDDIRQRRSGEKQSGPPLSARSQVEPALAGPPPPHVEASAARIVEPGEFTRLFHTAPSPQPTMPTAPQSVASQPAPEDATRLFVVPRPKAAPDQSLTDEAQAPTDTVLTISNCADGALLNARTALDHFPFTIGRDGADWNLAFDPAISARHVEIDYREGGFFIRDLGSSNGAFVSGRRLKPLQPEVLLFGARILLGSNTEIVFGSGVMKEIPDLCGMLVGNRFTLLQKLHSSSKSVLYLAKDENLPRNVAVKLLSPSLIRHAGYREQFSREAQTASLLRHSRICQVLDYGELRLADPPGNRTLYVCMEFLSGGSFQSRLNRPDPFPMQQVGSWLDTICDALAYVHEHQVVHSGIKPSAIVFDIAENPYLTDFAFATRSGEGLRQGVIGSPAFLAPEQWDGAEPVPATDIYSLAVLFYWLIGGGLPYEGQEHIVVRNRNFLRGPLPVHEMAAHNGRPAVPARISPVFEQALALTPAARFPSAREFAGAFRSALVAPDPVRSRRSSVFVSYQRAESSLLADMIKKEIERESGYQVFVDAIQQDSSEQFPLKLRRKIEQCDAFICLLGRSTLASDWVKLEIQVAAEHAKPMIPVFQESYQARNLREFEPHIQELLTYEGVKILDRQNLFIDAAIQSLIALTRRSIEYPEPKVHTAQLPETVTEGLMSKLLAFVRRWFK